MTPGSVHELRTDPITGEQVLFSTARASRPGNISPYNALVSPAERGEVCPFCRGNEHLTPPATAQLPSPDSNQPWQVRAFLNKYPVVVPEVEPQVTGTGLFENLPITGFHEVISETPNCGTQLHEETAENIFLVLSLYRERMRQLALEPKIQSFQIFKNHGHNAGATMYHAHSQLLALGFVTQRLRNSLARLSLYAQNTGRHLVRDLLDSETSADLRLISSGSNIAALAPFAATQPFETHFYPHEVRPHFADTHDEELYELAQKLKVIFMKLHAIHGKFAYNMTLVTAPVNLPGQSEDFCWHLKLIPRLTGIAGFELESGCRINPVLPESCAQMLRM